MNTINFLSERADFVPLWQRAIAAVEALRDKPSTDLLYFDAIDLQTQKFFDLIQHLLALTGATDFATLVLKPDPFRYFHFHFGKYPGFIHHSHNTADEFFEFLLEDPGASPADALGSNSQQYVVLPLPGDWIVFGDRWWETAVLSGPPDIMECAKRFYPFFLEPPSGFRIEL
ncbi:hypothetical protein WS87_23805 [Burkholderia sp. MSMB0856]|uniref:hypothetical protein n=1 Tax=Burkholderia sp. MSMB0856 TaxID=1637869 RepID=UPI00075498C6|nr:hypothetical protein [Burkholderia sp. MSMB0856]AOJ89693.1 hypothetical protein WS87_23805 [Burkholderia sp. MSMB0856]KVH34553.1 hypothetical protein WS87_20120 [Burkholderia sp. MSMB0856]